MADPLSSLIRPDTGPQLPAFERLAPPPSENVVAAELAARTAPGDVVIDIHGRGGWIARTAIGALRRVYSCESTPLTRLLSETVLRPPDLRHFDAGLATIATYPRGDLDLQRRIEQQFTSRCPTCGRPVVVQEYIWEAGSDVPSRKVFRCSFCREQARSGEPRVAPVDDDDVVLSLDNEGRNAARDALRTRFPILGSASPLPDELLDLYTPRTLFSLELIIERLDTQLKAAPIDAGLKLGLIHALLATSRLNGYPGRIAALRVRHGHVQHPESKAWRERNPWLAFEEGCREVRTFVARLEAGTASFQPRPGDDIETLIDGTANVVLRTGPAYSAGNEPMFWSRRPVLPGRLDPRSRVRLVLTQPPIRWSVENISFAYLATSLALGKEAAAQLPLEWLFGAPPSNDRGREATALRRSLLSVRPVLARDAKAVVLLDPGGAAGLVAGVLGGVGAGLHLTNALLAESGNRIGGLLEFNVGPASDDEESPPELADLPRADPDAPFALADVERAVTQVAVSVLQARGEPAGAERLLGEVLVGLDRLGHLRRLVGTQTFSETQAAADLPATTEELTEEPSATQAEDAGSATEAESEEQESTHGEVPDWALGSASATDHVRLLMEIVMGELRRADHPRLLEVDRGRWWLRSDADLAGARPPLSDRLEWAAYGLLSTSRELQDETFFERVAGMFRGHDAPDPELVRAILSSYRDPAQISVALRPVDELTARTAEHGEVVGMLVDYGHRLGLRAHVSDREQRRHYRGGTVADLLSEEEQRAYMPLIVPGDARIFDELDCVWYLRGKATFLFEVEWTAMLTEALLRRGPRVQNADSVFRFLVIPAERTELVRFKLARSPLLARALDEQNWHILKSNHLRRLFAREEADLDQLAPMLGLDPEVEREAEQLALFG